MKSSHQAVNDALRFPLGEQFEADLTAMLQDEDSGASTVIALIDLDSFLHINEDFGTEAGDQMLIAMGRHLADGLPETAKVYRIAGDQFGIIFHGDMEKEAVFLYMENVRKTFDVKAPDGETMTISVGIAAAFDDASRYQELFHKADSAMYRAKFNGRNMVALAREEKMVPKTSHYSSEQLKRLTKLSKREGIGEAVLLREALDMLLKKYEN